MKTGNGTPRLNGDYNGLKEKEAEKKLEIHGLNIIESKKGISTFKIFLNQFKDFMVLILIASTLVSAAMGEIIEAVTIVAIIVINSVLGFVQEFKTERTLDALKEMAAPGCRVVRDGKVNEIPATQVVPGDLIIIEEGDKVAADSVLVEAKNINVDESLLTGESVPVDKNAHNENNGKYPENEACIFMGTAITRGRGRAIAFATGMKTEMGKIADMIQNSEDNETPLQKRLDQLGKYIVMGCLLVCAIVSITGVLRGEAVLTMLMAGISLAVAAVPEGLPAVVTIALAIGVQRMLKRRALVRKLPSVEALGCADIICSDKTGTLTENRMQVKSIYTAGRIFTVKNSRRNKTEFMFRDRKVSPDASKPLSLVLKAGALCGNVSIELPERKTISIISKIKKKIKTPESWHLNGDPTEKALMEAALGAGLIDDVLHNNKKLDEIPFDSDRKCMSVLCKDALHGHYVYTKGAPGVGLEKCGKILTSNGIVPMDKALKTGILTINDRMASEALRVLGIGYKKLNGRSFLGKMENSLVFVGLVGMMDPPRKEAYEAVKKCRLAGIKPVMITGDHRLTAHAIAKELHIWQSTDKILTGSDLDRLGEYGLQRIAENVSVYARVTPRHKLAIVKTLKKMGHTVAMTGDGVNDAPAVKEADIGVSMGLTGTDVTREASSMILTDDNFATIVSAVEEGRIIYSNIRKFIRYLLSCNIGEVLTMFLGMLVGLPIPLLPIQILWVNLVTDGLPAIALGLEPAEKDIMTDPPRKSGENIFSDGLGFLIIKRGLLLGLCTLAVFASILYFTGNVPLARTGGFMTLVLTQLIHVFECKSEKRTIFEIPLFNNVLLVFAVLCSLCMILAAVYIPFLQNIFKTVPLTPDEWVLILGFSILGPIFSSFFKKKKYKPS